MLCTHCDPNVYTTSYDLTVKNGPEDDYLLVETCSPHITLCNNKYSRADLQYFSITLRILALCDAFIQTLCVIYTATCFDNVMSPSDSLQPISC